jgi:hypothetical protein
MYGTTSKVIILLGCLEAVWSIIRLFLIVTALIYLALKKHIFELLIFISWIVYFPLLTGFDGCGRYRLVIEPILSVLAAAGFYVIKNSIKSYVVVQRAF